MPAIKVGSVTRLVLFSLISLTLAFCAKAYQREFAKRVNASSDVIKIPLGISKRLWRRRIPPNNRMSPAKVALGEALYFDKRLSVDGTVSCATCHDPANAFTDHGVVAVGVSNKSGTRNAPTILNAMFNRQLFWDGRVDSLEEQAKQPLTNPFEMGMLNTAAIVERIRAVSEYEDKFRRAFGDESITIEMIVKAIAAFERTQLSANSPFDRFIAGDKSALTKAQKRGWTLFNNKAKCIECHAFSAVSPFFTDFKFHNTGVVARNMDFDQLARFASEIANAQTASGGDTSNTSLSAVTHSSNTQVETLTPLLAHTPGFTELGRFLVTKQPKDLGAFKTPTLRDVELTTPYMHNGSEKTLIDVVRFYNRGGNPNAALDKNMRPLNLSEEEMNDLVEFMRALTSYDVVWRSQGTRPQSREAVRVKPDE